MDSPPVPNVLVRAGPMGSLRRDSSRPLANASVSLESRTLFWLLLGQIGSAICDSIYQLRPSNLCSVIGSTVRGAIDSIFSIFNPSQRLVHKWVRKEVPFRDIPNITTVWADGTILCVIVENAIAPNPDTKFHQEKYHNLGHVTLPNIRLGQKLAQQYLFVDPEFSNAEMQREADAEIIHRLVKYLQNVKRASKLAKNKQPFEIERRPTYKEIMDEAQKVKNQKSKRKIKRRKRRSKTPEKTALNYSLVSSTVIPEAKDDQEQVAQVQHLLNHDLFNDKCEEIESVCEMLMVRSNKRKSLQIFNTATQILSTRKSSVDDEKAKLIDDGEGKNDTDDNCKKTDSPLGEQTRQRRISLNVETMRRTSVDDKGRNSRRNSSSLQKQESVKEERKKPPKTKAKPKLDFSKTDFSLLGKMDQMLETRRQSVESVAQQIENLASDIANMNVTEDAISDGVFFARRLSQSSLINNEIKQNANDSYLKQKVKRKSPRNANIVRPEFNSNVFQARRDAFQATTPESRSSEESRVSSERRKKSLGAHVEETKRRYESAKNFFKTMEQQVGFVGRRGSDTQTLPTAPPPETRKFSSCRSTRPPGRLHVADVFCRDENSMYESVKTIKGPDMSALVASLNSAYNENETRPCSPYALVREGNEEDDSEPPSPERQAMDFSRRRVSYSQLNQEGDAGIF
ncbi:uncharacterized protein LOC132203489 [Neocloeon triangulifer]|uniref:uncharacterized protein LOC132203489 n=1 Tax=Neocloeon triangulifer TaxID=2078957 RepID=UPI00286EED4B|nr:uncharacterized protein LOC132203489 [Neocloeon triangulifer]